MKYTDVQIKFILKLKKFGLTCPEIAEKFNIEFDQNRNSDMLDKVVRRYQSQYVITDEELNDDNYIKNLKVTHNARKANSKLRKENSIILDHQVALDQFLVELSTIEAKHPVKLHKKVTLPPKKKTKRTVVAHMADNHIGVIIHAETMGGLNSFNPEIAARRIAYYVQSVSQYKTHHRQESDLLLIFNGDMLHGIIHGTDTANVLPASIQHAIALRIYAQAISFLAQSYKSIRIVGETGNHSRFTHKLNKGRQTEEKWDSFETILYLSLQEKFRDYKNIEFVISKTPYTIIDIQGHKALITHGDTVINVGNPGKSINVDSITKQINSISKSLGYNIDLIFVGHVHKATYIVLDNGTHLVINGPLSGTDEYVQSLGILSSNPYQQILEVTPGEIVGDMRFVRVDKADKDASLDKIIKLESMFV